MDHAYNSPGSGGDYAAASVDPTDGSLHLTGRCETPADSDWITLRISPDGRLLWAIRFDGAAHSGDNPEAVVVDPARARVVVTGSSYNGELFDVATVAYGRDWAGRGLRVSGDRDLGLLRLRLPCGATATTRRAVRRTRGSQSRSTNATGRSWCSATPSAASTC